jgi:hypothetical protein
MNAIQKEVDELIHMMRQSRMDNIRKHLEKQVRRKEKGDERAEQFLFMLYKMFAETSTLKPK